MTITARAPAETKRCPCCGETKALTEFHRNKAAKDGRQSKCKSCACAIASKWSRDHPERNRERLRTWRAANPERYREQRRRASAAYGARQRAEREACRAEWMARAQEAARP